MGHISIADPLPRWLMTP